MKKSSYYYIIKLMPFQVYNEYSESFYISVSNIAKIEEILKTNGVKYILTGSFNPAVVDEEQEINNLYKHFSTKKSLYEEHTWWNGTELDKQYNKKSSSGYINKEMAEDIAVFLGKMQANPNTKKCKLEILDAINKKIKINITQDISTEFTQKYVQNVAEVLQNDLVMKSLGKFAKDNGIQLSSEETTSFDDAIKRWYAKESLANNPEVKEENKTNNEENSESENDDKPYISLE